MALPYALYALVTGLALGLSLLVWHVWSDNAFVAVYLVATLLLASGAIVAVVALFRRAGIARGVAIVVAAVAVTVVLAGPLSMTRPLAELVVAGGNGSQSPCVAEFRLQNAEEIRRHDEEMLAREAALGIRPPTAEEIRASDIGGVAGVLSQVLTPFLAGAVTLAFAARRDERRHLLRALVVAGAVVTFVYVRGAGAWCGVPYGLDSLAAIVAGAVIVTRR